MLGFKQWASVVVLTATAGVHAASRDLIDVQLTAPTPVIKGDVDVVVGVTVTNRNNHPVTLLKSQLPESADAAQFKITRNDERVTYQGRVIKRNTPQAKEYVKLEPGASLHYDVELTTNYDLSQNGRYAIEYLSRGRHGDAATLNSQPLYLWLEERTPQPQMSIAFEPQATVAAAGTLSFASCSSSQKTAIRTAVTNATNYAAAAADYLSDSATLTQRYKKWFGTPLSGWNTAYSHFVAVQSAFQSKAITVDCGCSDDVYAYVYPTRPYRIYVCNDFWNAPATGKDSKAGTLVHEMTHFNVVAGTDDWAYSQSGAASLAISNPTRALDNADSHEYFAENAPFLP